jgi:UDP-GlcNAc3NAcA epimerase
MYDASLHYRSVSHKRSEIIRRLDLQDFVLCTLHRAENTDNLENLRSIFEGLNRIARETSIVMPLHPRTKKAMDAAGVTAEFATIDPVGYLDMIELVRRCKLVITDSGGLQKEAFFFEKGCVTLRDETEWIELVELGCNVLAGSGGVHVCEAYRNMVAAGLRFEDGLYGDGRASLRIVDELKTSIRSRPHLR